MAHPALLLALLLAVVGCGTSVVEEVDLLATDAVPVRVLRYPAGEGAVILVSAPGRSPQEWEGMALRMTQEGWTVLVVAPRDSTDPAQVARDVEGVLRHLAGRPVVLVGEGAGAGGALWAAGRHQVEAVVMLGPTQHPGLLQRMRRVAEPKLLMAAVGDDRAVEAQARLAANAPAPVRVRTYPGDRSGLELLIADDAAVADMLAFLRFALEVP